MSARKVCVSMFLACLLALPLAGLDVSSVKQGAPVRRGRTWEQSSEFEAPVKEGGRLLLRTEQGAINIRPVPGDRVSCAVVLRAYTADEAEAKRLFDAFQLTARSVEGGGVYLSSESPFRVRHGASFRVNFQISVPQRFHLDVETQSGDITVEAPLEGNARLTTAGGDVRTSDISGLVRIETAGGSITLANINGDLTARTAGGSIRVGDVKGDTVLETSGGEIDTGRVTGTVKAETAGGDVVIGGATGDILARTAGGQIQIGPAASSVRAETAGGSIRLQGARGRVVAETAGGSIDLLEMEGAVRASTAAGRILAKFNNGMKTFGPSRLETSLGDVYVYLPTNLPITIDAAIDTAAGRRIQSDFPLDIQGSTEELVPTTLRGRGNVNGGGEVLRIRTVSGNIEIRKIDDASLRELQQLEESNWNTGQERHTEGNHPHPELHNERHPHPPNRDEENHDQ
jgi:DUF4097 and DUF4098 domain-containing protein YvlB